MTDIATISLRVNTQEVERGSKVLDDFGKTAQDTAKKSDDLNRVFKTGPQAVKQASASIADQRKELQALLDKISPVNRALNQLDDMQEKLRAASKKGLLPAEDFTHYNDILEKTRDKITGVGKETEELGLKSASARREIGVLIGELARGNIGALRGSGITLANRAGWIDQLMTLRGLGVAGVIGGISAAVYVLGKAWYEGNQESVEFNKQLILTGNYAGQTAASLSVMSKALSGNGITQHAAADVLAKVVGSGKFDGKQLEQVAKTAVMMQETVGQSVETTISQFEKLRDAPTKASEELNQQMHYLTAAQLEYISSLERRGDKEAAAAAAQADFAAAQKQRTQATLDNLGTIEQAIRSATKRWNEFWDAALNIGRQTTDQSLLDTVNQQIAQFEKTRASAAAAGKTDWMGDGYRKLLEQRKELEFVIKSQQGYTAAQKASQKVNEDAIAAQQVANKWLDAGTTAAEKRTRAQNDLNKAIEANAKAARQTANAPDEKNRVQKWSDADIAKMRAGIDKQYKDPKTAKPQAVKVDSGERETESAKRHLDDLKDQLKALQEQYNTGKKISQEQLAYQAAERKYAQLLEVSQHRQLTTQEKQQLASSKQTLELKRQQAEVGDQIVAQQKLNELHQRATKFIEQQNAKQAELKALSEGKTPEEAQQEATLKRLGDSYKGKDAQDVLAQQKETYKQEADLRQNWQAGAKSAWTEWEKNATDSYKMVGDITTETFDGMTDVLTNFLTTGKAGFKDFATSILSDLAKMLVKMSEAQAMQAAFGAMKGSSFASFLGFAGGGYTGEGGKYEPKGVVHGGEFVFNKEATSRIGVGNLYAMMQGKPGYADGGYVGKASMKGLSGGGIGGGINVSTSVVVQTDGQQGGSDPAAGAALQKELKRQMDEAARNIVNQAIRPGGAIWNFQKSRRQ